MMHRLLEVGIIGGISGGALALLLAVIEKIRGKPLVEAPPEPMTRDEMIDRLQAMIDDPATPARQREKAQRRLQAFMRLDESS